MTQTSTYVTLEVARTTFEDVFNRLKAAHSLMVYIDVTNKALVLGDVGLVCEYIDFQIVDGEGIVIIDKPAQVIEFKIQSKPPSGYGSLCPTCQGEAVTVCRCVLGDTRCANGHNWHVCKIHGLVPYKAKHSGLKDDGCTCQKEK